MEKVKVYQSTIPSDINYIGNEVNNVIKFLKDCCKRINECTVFEIKVILNELLLNAVKHGNKQDNNKHIKISVGINLGGYAVIDIEDQGEGYDFNYFLNNAQQMCKENNILNMKETGRGLLIVKDLCEDIEFNKEGRKVTVKKMLHNL